MIDEDAIRRHFELLRPTLDERGRRLFAASQVRALGSGSLAAVARSTIGRGLKELDRGEDAGTRVRRPGGGRKLATATDVTLEQDLLALVEPMTLGCPERPLLWVSRSTEKLAVELRKMEHTVSGNTVRRLLRRLGFSRQGNYKANEGHGHPDRMGSSNTSTSKSWRSRRRTSWSFRWIQKRRNWLAITRMVAPTGGRKAGRSTSTFMTL